MCTPLEIHPAFTPSVIPLANPTDITDVPHAEAKSKRRRITSQTIVAMRCINKARGRGNDRVRCIDNRRTRKAPEQVVRPIHPCRTVDYSTHPHRFAISRAVIIPGDNVAFKCHAHMRFGPRHRELALARIDENVVAHDIAAPVVLVVAVRPSIANPSIISSSVQMTRFPRQEGRHDGQRAPPEACRLISRT